MTVGFVAGASRMSSGRFLLFNLAGAFDLQRIRDFDHVTACHSLPLDMFFLRCAVLAFSHASSC